MAESLEETRDRLLTELQGRRADIDRLYDYYRGDHPIPWAPREVRDAYRALLRMSRSNWCRLIVKAPSERLRPTGLKFSDSSEGDVEAWRRYWQGNRLDRNCRLVHDAALVARRGFVLVWPRGPGDGPGPPRITPEHPAQTIVDYEPGDCWERRAALKTFNDPTMGRRYCTLWTADEVANWWAPQTTSPLYVPGGASSWQPWTDDTEGIVPRADNPMGEVPVVEFVGDPVMLGDPMGELDGGVTDIQDRINKTILDRMVTSNFSSFRQKWVTGMDVPKDEQGNDVEPFRSAVDRLFVATDSETRFGEFSESDLAGYITSVEADIQHLAAITRTPPHYLLGQSGAFPSGESLKATETGLVAKVLERRDSFTESWEEAIRLALLADDDGRAGDMALSLVWMEPESRSETEIADAVTKYASVGFPFRWLAEYRGCTPTEIDGLDAERMNDMATNLFAAAQAPSTPAGVQPASVAPAMPPTPAPGLPAPVPAGAGR